MIVVGGAGAQSISRSNLYVIIIPIHHEIHVRSHRNLLSMGRCNFASSLQLQHRHFSANFRYGHDHHSILNRLRQKEMTQK